MTESKLVEEVVKAIWEANNRPPDDEDFAEREASAAINVILGRLREPGEEVMEVAFSQYADAWDECNEAVGIKNQSCRSALLRPSPSIKAERRGT